MNKWREEGESNPIGGEHVAPLFPDTAEPHGWTATLKQINLITKFINYPACRSRDRWAVFY
jgi:hypothetical protein